MSGRIRTIKPELLEDAVTAGLSDTSFRIFMAAIVLADDYGGFRAEPEFIRGQVFWKNVPSTPLEFALAELAPIVQFYEINGQRYGHIRNWEKHQKVAHRGKRRIPAPPSSSDTPPEPLRKSSGDSHEDLMKSSGGSPEILMPDLRPMDHRPRPMEGDSATVVALPPEAGSGVVALPKVGRARKQRPETDCPATEAAPEVVTAWCAEWGIPDAGQDAEAGRFLNHHRSKENRHRDWLAAWRKWQANAVAWGKPRGGINQQPPETGRLWKVGTDE